MPYLGNTVGNRFVASKAATQFSGDGSTTAFTLEHAVGSDEDILVSVDGVIQEPSVAYAVSNGTTLTFTGAPSNNSGNNIFVYYLFRTVATVDHPSTSSLQATDGTFTGAFTSLGIDDNASSNVITVSTGGLTLSPATSNLYLANGALSYYGTTNNVYLNGAGSGGGLLLSGDGTRAENIDIDASENNIKFTVGTAERMKIDSNGHITMPYQSAFLVTVSDYQNNIAVGVGVTVQFDDEKYDQNSDFDTSNYTFTAPVTGRYQFNATVRFNGDSAANYYWLQLQTSNRTYGTIFDPDFGQDFAYWTLSINTVADMDAGDTAIVVLAQNAGSQQTDINNSGTWSYFSGCLLA